MQKNNKIEDKVRSIVLHLIEPAGYELVDLEYKKESNDWILRLFIDREEGIKHEDCKTVSKQVSDELDKLDPIPHAYFLEVSSPGIERPLKTIKDFTRFSGEKIQIKLFSPYNGKKEYIGKLLGMENDQVVILDNASKLMFNLDEIAKARLVVDFN